MNALNSVKTALRIKHSKLDESLKADIDTAHDELKRVGVSSAFTVIKNGEIEDLKLFKHIAYGKIPTPINLWKSTEMHFTCKLMD